MTYSHLTIIASMTSGLGFYFFGSIRKGLIASTNIWHLGAFSVYRKCDFDFYNSKSIKIHLSKVPFILNHYKTFEPSHTSIRHSPWNDSFRQPADNPSCVVQSRSAQMPRKKQTNRVCKPGQKETSADVNRAEYLACVKKHSEFGLNLVTANTAGKRTPGGGFK